MILLAGGGALPRLPIPAGSSALLFARLGRARLDVELVFPVRDVFVRLTAFPGREGETGKGKSVGGSGGGGGGGGVREEGRPWLEDCGDEGGKGG